MIIEHLICEDSQEWRLELEGRGRSVQLALLAVLCPPQVDHRLDRGCCFLESFDHGSCSIMPMA